jgi:hypothetical protein
MFLEVHILSISDTHVIQLFIVSPELQINSVLLTKIHSYSFLGPPQWVEYDMEIMEEECMMDEVDDQDQGSDHECVVGPRQLFEDSQSGSKGKFIIYD